jgi:hypothetical protein
MEFLLFLGTCILVILWRRTGELAHRQAHTDRQIAHLDARIAALTRAAPQEAVELRPALAAAPEAEEGPGLASTPRFAPPSPAIPTVAWNEGAITSSRRGSIRPWDLPVDALEDQARMASPAMASATEADLPAAEPEILEPEVPAVVYSRMQHPRGPVAPTRA